MDVIPESTDRCRWFESRKENDLVKEQYRWVVKLTYVICRCCVMGPNVNPTFYLYPLILKS
jgi:hypothetical protein